MLLEGKQCVEKRLEELKTKVLKMEKKPTLAIIHVCGDDASDIYIHNKFKRCIQVGITPKLFYFLDSASQESIADKIRELNADDDTTGIILQLPLPDHMDPRYLTNLIDPRKDVDGFTELNTGRLFLGMDGLVSCTPKGIMELLDFYDISLEGKDVLIINRSNIVGKPLAHLMMRRDATVTIAHSKTENLMEKIKQADVVVTAVGIPNFLSKDNFKDGATIIDVSMNRLDGKLCGDVRKEDYMELMVRCNLTPVPGGVGQTTVMALLENVISIMENK
jgi:methylenetetrahydrofolate dehydrogenase (NADP+)/methenyltetrahydrofolate cyclohydrolase